VPRYFYKAKNIKGEEESGILEAQSYSHLARILHQKGYFLVNAEEEGEEKEFGKKETSFLLDVFYRLYDGFKNLFPVPLAEKLFFTKNLEVMMRTGIPLPQAFEILSNQTKTRKFKKALKEISKMIIKGETLSRSMKRFPDIFPNVFQEAVKIGEETGKTEDSLKILSLQMEREYSLKSKVKTAMVYPTVVLAMAFLIGILMFVVAVPKLKDAFQELEMELPFTTRIMLSFSDFLINKWPLFILVVGFVLITIALSLKKKGSGRIKGKIALKLPMISRIVRLVNSALALRTLSSLLAAGVPIVRSLRVASGSLGNFYFRKSLREAAEVVEKGRKLSEALSPYEYLYSSMVLEMIKVGEETGETPQVLKNLADFYETEIASSLEKISSVIEPFLILIIGGVVGFFAISMMQPMFSIMKGF